MDGLDSGRAQLRAVVAWVRMRVAEPSTWVGMAMIAVALGRDPTEAHGMAQAISLIVGGGLVGVGPTAGAEKDR